MGKVLKADATVDFAWAEKDLGSAHSEIWLTYRTSFDAASLALWIAIGISEDFDELWDAAHAVIQDGASVIDFGTLAWGTFFANGGTPLAETSQTVEHHLLNGGAGAGVSEFYVDGVLVASDTGLTVDSVRYVRLGLSQADPLNPFGGVAFFGDVKVGTTRGDSDLFADDFSSGNLLAWSSTSGDVSVVDDPFPPPAPPRIVVQADAPIRTLITDMDSRTIAHFDRLETDRAWLYTLNAPAYHTGQVPSDSLEVNRPFPDADSPANLTNNRRLIFSLQRWKGSTPPYQPIFGGIVTIPEDQGTDAPTTRYTAHDPWQLMMSRPIRDPDTGDLPGPDGITFAVGSRASDIALSFLAQTEAFDGETHIDSSDSGLIEATDPLPSEITFEEGTMVGEAWTQLVETGTIDIHLPPMYEPIDAPGKVVRFQTVRQADGVAAGPIRADAVMGWDRAGNSVAELNRLVDGTRMANTVAFYDANGNAVPIQTDAASVLANGVYFAQQFFPGANDTTLIALLAVAQLAIRRKGQRSISLSPTPERTVMPLRDYELGDYLPVWASSNLREPLGVDYLTFDPDNPGASGYQRVYAIPLAADDNGVTQVTGLLTSKEN